MPDWAGGIRQRLGPAAIRPEREAEIIEELSQHLSDRYQSLISAGSSPSEAEREAWRELEEADILGRRITEIERAPASLTHLESDRADGVVVGLWADTRYALRAIFKHRVLSFTAIVCIAFSLGPATAVVGVAEALFFRPLPGIARQGRLVSYLFGTEAGPGVSWVHFISYVNEEDLSRGARTVAGISGFQPLGSAALAAGSSEPRLTTGAAVNANYFDLLGVRLVGGRAFLANEDQNPGGEPVVVLSEPRARDLFGSVDAAVGHGVFINQVSFTVIGVAPAAFAGTDPASHVDFWIPGMAYKRATHVPQERWAYAPSAGPFYQFIVRMTEGATVDQTTAELKARARALAAEDPRQNGSFKTVGPILRPGFAAPASTRPEALRITQLMAGVAGLLVLLGMATVANLLIFRGLASARDIATRKTLGASTRRLVQLRLLESLLLAVAGGAAGVGVALLLRALFTGFAVPAIGSIDVAMDWHVFVAVSCLSLAVGVGFGVAPALVAARSSIGATLGRGAHAELPRARRLRNGLAAVQIALSLALLVGALLFLSTLHNLHAVDLGFDPKGVVMIPLQLSAHGYSDARALDYAERLSEALRREPGVQSVALAFSPPLFGGVYRSNIYAFGADPKTATNVTLDPVGNDYFRTLKLPLASGRGLTRDEAFGITHQDELPIVVSETFARALFGSVDVEGQRLSMTKYQAPPTTLLIVGVARLARFGAIDEPPDPVVYTPLTQFPASRGEFLLVRSTLTATDAGQVIMRAAAAIDASVPVAADTTFASVIDKQLGQQRLFAWLLALLACVGFVLSGVGLHGLVAQTVTERRREFGIRIAIGADPTRILQSVVWQAAGLSLSGVLGGVLLAWLSARVVQNRLYGITSRDPVVYVAAIVAMACVVLLATYLPARAAMRVDPVDVLKQE